MFLTGASGFIGGYFYKTYFADYDIVPISLRKQTVGSLDFKDVEAVVHCAALVHQMEGAPAELYFKINRDLTLELARRAKMERVKHFVFLSTSHVFGDSGQVKDHDKIWSSQDECHPLDPYGQSKLEAEKGLLELANEGFKVSILRPPMVYGPGAKGNIIQLAKLIRKFRVLPLGYLKNRRSLIFIGNLCFYIKCLIEEPKTGIFLPQDEKPLSIGEICEAIAQAMNQNLTLLPLPNLVIWVAEKFTPSIAYRLFGTLAFANDPWLEKFERLTSTQEGFQRSFAPRNKEG
ncbi:MAG: NAD-dependent epimerase/dehydratase family protein [Bdellovibrionales bacterium]|nr:NAD-dependent epimerase/dehydratase family protein [Bdellovibrionales bacterium]